MKFLLSLLLVASCSFKKGQEVNQTQKGHEELYSHPSVPKLEKLEDNEKRIVIAATNDVQGHYQTHKIVFKDEHENKLQSVQVGGIDTIQNYFKILRETYPNVVLVDSGDIFANANSTNTVKEFYQSLKYDAITVGLNDFNLKLPSSISTSAELFKQFSKTANTPVVLSNLYDLKTARVVEWPGSKPYIMKDFGGVKVGIIGIIPNDIVGQTPVNNRVGLFVEDMIQSTLRNARLLRSLGADMIVVLTHQGVDCNSELAGTTKLPLSKVNFDPQHSSCDLKSPLGQYLERLPPNLVDVVIGGRTHQKTANIINNTLVMSSYPDGKSFSFAEFVVNTKTKKLVTEKMVVHQPVMFCQEFFKETNDCYTEDPSVEHKKRVPATFLGQPIAIPGDAKVSSIQKIPAYSDSDIMKGLVEFTTDLAYVPNANGHSQFFVLTISGKELLNLLDVDFNRGIKESWKPLPFKVTQNELELMVGGRKIDTSRNYRILADLEAIQNHPTLVKHLNHPEGQSLTNYSWSSYLKKDDAISTKMAAQVR